MKKPRSLGILFQCGVNILRDYLKKQFIVNCQDERSTYLDTAEAHI